MIGSNKVILNMDQVVDIMDKHLRDEILKDGNFKVEKVQFDYQTQTVIVSLGPKETEA